MAINNNDKLTSHPFTNVGDWVYQRDKITHPDPLRKHKKKTVKVNKIHTGNSRTLFETFVAKWNKFVTEWVILQNTTIPALEQRMDDLETDLTNQMSSVSSELSSHKSSQTAHSSGGGQTSDRRLKYDVNMIGTSPSGLNIYTFRFKDSKYGSGLYQGVMSDEVPKSVVSQNEEGYDLVNYSQIDVDFHQIYE